MRLGETRCDVILDFVELKSPNLEVGGDEGRDGLGDTGGPGIFGMKDMGTCGEHVSTGLGVVGADLLNGDGGGPGIFGIGDAGYDGDTASARSAMRRPDTVGRGILILIVSCALDDIPL
jgi:hypothetical protein